MSVHTLKPVILKHTHAIKSRKDYVSDPYSGKAFDRKVKDGYVLDKSIHSYRMWFNFLKLALELETQNTILVTRNATLRKYMSGHQSTGRVTHKVRVNRAKYRDWDLHDLVYLSFDEWWKEHEHLFLDQVSRVLKPHDVVSTDPDRLAVDIDLRRKMNDVINDIKNLYRENAIERVTREQYPIEGRVRPIVLQNKFNALVLKLEDKLSNQEILTHKDNYIRASDTRTAKGRSQNEGRVINELIGGNAQKNSFGAKQILLSVCDGYFMMHPTKNYL
jgi:hypothetical protein